MTGVLREMNELESTYFFLGGGYYSFLRVKVFLKLIFCIETSMAFTFTNGAFKWDFEVILYMNFANSLMRYCQVGRKVSCLAC